MCLSKSIAGGLPMGAVLMGERVGELPTASHGSTFGGNPLACAAGLAVLDILNRQDARNAEEKNVFGETEEQSSREIDLVARARELGDEVMAHFRATLPERAVREVRGRGLMIGIELRGKVAPVLKLLQARGVLALPAGPSVLRLLPPLVISDDDLWQAAAILEEVLNNAF
jgi:acetylornithine/LysW-gamma-L-lysine aminotransferase